MYSMFDKPGLPNQLHGMQKKNNIKEQYPMKLIRSIRAFCCV